MNTFVLSNIFEPVNVIKKVLITKISKLIRVFYQTKARASGRLIMDD